MKVNNNELFEGYLNQVSKTVHSSSLGNQMGFKTIDDLKIALIGIEEFLNNNPPSTENKYANTDEAVLKYHNLRSAAETIKEDLRDILLRIYNIKPIIKQLEGTD